MTGGERPIESYASIGRRPPVTTVWASAERGGSTADGARGRTCDAHILLEAQSCELAAIKPRGLVRHCHAAQQSSRPVQGGRLPPYRPSNHFPFATGAWARLRQWASDLRCPTRWGARWSCAASVLTRSPLTAWSRAFRLLALRYGAWSWQALAADIYRSSKDEGQVGDGCRDCSGRLGRARASRARPLQGRGSSGGGEPRSEPKRRNPCTIVVLTRSSGRLHW